MPILHWDFTITDANMLEEMRDVWQNPARLAEEMAQALFDGSQRNEKG